MIRITWIVAAIALILFAIAIDNGIIPFIGCLVCLSWLFLGLIANWDQIARYERKMMERR